MRSFRNKRGPYGDGEISSKDGYPEQDNGWGWDEFQSDPIRERQRLEESKYIELANNKLSLSSVFKKYNIQFDSDNFNYSGWTHKCLCPFPDHNEKTASFGYNPSIDRFNCFGCKRGGRSVQFISYMEDIPQIRVAKNCLGHLITFDGEDDSFIFDEKKKVKKILFEYADYVRNFKIKNGLGIASEYADNIGWNLDVFLRKNFFNGVILSDDLEARINKNKEYLEAFGEPDEI